MDIVQEGASCNPPVTPGRDGRETLDIVQPEWPDRSQLNIQRPCQDAARTSSSGNSRRRLGEPSTAAIHERFAKFGGSSAWLPPDAPAPMLPRARFGPLPSRRPYAPAGALKQPRGLASCVIREDMPYPPANAEVTFEIRTTTVRHGRKLLRYLASSPLDTIYIKIPHVSPTSLQQPILEGLRHTIDLGHQRIVVGGGVSPGCALVALEVLGPDLLGEDDDHDREAGAAGRELRATEASGGQSGEGRRGDGGRGGGSGTSWLRAISKLVSEGGGVGGGIRGADSAVGSGDGGGRERADAAAAVVGRGLSRWLRKLGLEVAEGQRLQLQLLGSVLEAEFCGPKEGDWAFRTLPLSLPSPAPALSSSPAAAHPAAVSLSVQRQVLVAPTAVGEAVKISVCAHGLPDMATEEGGGGGSGAGRYGFMVRVLGRMLPVLAVPAPVTPGLDYPCREDSTGCEVTTMICGNVGGSISSQGSALAAAVAAAAVAAAADGNDDGEATEADSQDEVGGVVDDLDACAGPEAQGQAASGVARGVAAAQVFTRQYAAQSTCRTPRPDEPVGAGHGAVAGGSQSPNRRSREAVAAEQSCQYELAVSGLATGRNGSSRPMLLQLELWQDNSRLLASKPLLLLPPSLSELATHIHELLWLQLQLQQQELQKQEEADANVAAAASVAAAAALVAATATAAAAAGSEEMISSAAGSPGAQEDSSSEVCEAAAVHEQDGAPAASAAAVVSSDLGPSSADQLVSDLGLWLEFAHDALEEAAQEAAQEAAGAVGAVGEGQNQEQQLEPADGCIMQYGSLDLRPEVLHKLRRQSGFAAAMLRTGLGLLEAMTSYGSGLMVRRLLADFRSLGYGAAEVWEAAAASAAVAEAPSLLHVAAGSGDMTTLQAVAELAEAATATAGEGGGGSCWLLPDGDGRTPLHLLASAVGDGGAGAAAALEWVLASGDGGGDAARSAWRGAVDRYGLTPADVMTRVAAESDRWPPPILSPQLRRLLLNELMSGKPAVSAAAAATELALPFLRSFSDREQARRVLAAAGGSFDGPTGRGAAGAVAGASGASGGGSARMSSGAPGKCTSLQTEHDGAPAVAGATEDGLAASLQHLDQLAMTVPAAAAAETCGLRRGDGDGGGEVDRRPRSRAYATLSLLWACLVGFDAAPAAIGSKAAGDAARGPSGASGNGSPATWIPSVEARFQAFVTRRTLTLAQGWVVLHLLLMVSAVRRLLAEGRRHEVPAPLLYSSGHVMMLVVMRVAPGHRLYTPTRGAWWALTAAVRTTAKVAQLAGWVALPESTLRFVQRGVTLVSDGVLPALFEPCPLPYVLLTLLYDFVVTAAVYLRIGYTDSLMFALQRAALKCGVALSLRLAVDLQHRVAFLRSQKAAAASLVSAADGGSAESTSPASYAAARRCSVAVPPADGPPSGKSKLE